MEHSIADKALEMALQSGAAQARVTLTRSDENSVVFLDREPDKVMSSSSESLSLQLFVEGRYGSFSTNMLQSDALREFIRKAARSTRLLSVDPFRKLPDEALYYKGEAPDLGQWDPAIRTLSPEQRLEAASKVNMEAFDSWKGDILSLESEYGDLIDECYIADSQGFRGQTLQSSFTISTSCSLRGKGDEKPEAWWYDSAIAFNSLKLKGCALNALQRAFASVGPRILTSGKYSIVVENICASRLLSPILTAISGSSIQQGNSFLADKMGCKVFSSLLSIYDRPHTFAHSGARYFDSDGVATMDDAIIENGYVRKFFANTYFAAKMGMAATAESASVLKFSLSRDSDGNTLSLPQIMKAVGRGILITDFNGGNCNSATGDFSYGIKGFFFDDGERAYPVSGLNMTGNMKSLWSSLLYVGADPWESSRWQVPSLSFENVNISGI